MDVRLFMFVRMAIMWVRVQLSKSFHSLTNRCIEIDPEEAFVNKNTKKKLTKK